MSAEAVFRNLLRAAILILLALHLFSSQVRELDNDEYEHMHKAWMMKEGTVSRLHPPFAHNPMTEWIIIPFMSLTGESTAIIRVMRLVMFLVSCASLWTLYRIGREVLTGPTQALLAVLLVMGNRAWVTKAPEVRPDNLMLLFALLSFWVLLRYFRDPKPWRICLFAGLAVLSFLGKQTALVFYAPLAIVFAWDAVFVRKLLSGKIVVAVCAALAVLAQVNPVSGFLAEHLTYLLPNAVRFPATRILSRSFWFNPALFILFAIQLVRPLRLGGDARSVAKYMYAIVFCEMLVLFSMNRPFAQEHLVMIVFMGLLASGVCLDLARKGTWIVGCVLTVALAFPAAYELAASPFTRPLAPQMSITRTLLNVSERNDLVFDAYGQAIFRHHPLEPAFLIYLPQRFHRFPELKKKNVRYVIWDSHYFPNLPPIAKNWIFRNFQSIPQNTNILARINP